MKNLLHTLSFMLLTLIAIHTRANTYYVSPSGSDSNPGTITSPFKTWQKLSSVLKAGDTGYIRGGTYTSPLSPGANDWIVTWQNLTGTSSNPIVISAYPGEQPVLDFSGFSQSNNITAIRLNNCSWIHFYGLRVVNLLQSSNGNLIAGWEMHDCTNITLEFCSVDNIGGAGFRNTTGCNSFTYINCDASRCADAINTGGGSYGNADGFDANAGATTYIGCRAWWDSDDGFDCFNNDSHIYYKNCWSFRNGYRPGTYSDPGSQADGMGFKWGSTSTDQSANVLRTYTNCIAFQNKVWGFDQNVARCKAEFYNNTSYNNKAGGWATGYSITPREASILKNNISFSESVPVSDMSGLVNDHNTWNNLNASSASFALLDTSGVTKPRQSDGSLPVLQYLHLSANSNMINAGVSVASLQFSGSAPDLGAFEYSGSSPVNQPPVANAGSNQTFFLPTNAATLSGSGTDADGTITGYQWTKISGPSQFAISSPTLAKTNVSNLVEGEYQFELKVTDNSGATAKDTVSVTVNQNSNQSPIAKAGNSQSIVLPTSSVSVDGSNSTDPDGTIASYQWTKILGPASAVITNSNLAITNITSLVQGVYQFELKVTDNLGAVGKDTVQITVGGAPNQPPVANAGLDINITLPTNNVTLSGSGTDADGTVASDQWIRISGPSQYTLLSPGQPQTSVNNLVQGTYAFELKVTDNAGASDRDTVQIIVNPSPTPNQAPTANAGPDINITLPTNSVTLSGSGSDGDGTIASYQWNKVSGPSQYTISSPTQSSTSVNNLIAGIYQFQLTVTDNSGATDVDVVQITVVAPNQIPNADAGADINITLPTNSATLSGSGNDPDGNIVSYQWTKISGPAQYTIAFPTRTRTTINNLTEGIYTFQLQVTDNAGAVGTDIVQVTVNAAPQQPNQSPTANAGPDLSITLPTNNVTLNGNGSDPDGSIASYQWTMTSGPSQYDIASATQARTSINNLAEGVYEFQLQVTDNSGATDVDVVQITVNAAAPPPNQSPSADAGADIIITLPTNSTTLSGNGTDLDGTIASYQWNEISGPSQYTIVSPGTSQTTVDGLTQGVYAFELTVTDNSGAIAKDIVQITVNAAAPPPNQPPSANAGADIVITLPTNSTTLSGSGTDPDGWASYQWRRISGPSQYNIASPNSVQTSVNNLTQGVYAFELMATDNNGATAKDTVQITVNAAPNQSPVADAGTDINITLPTNSITLSGSGIDPDGTIASYRWTKIGGPAQYTMVSSSVAKTSVTNLVQGSYSFEFTVTDNAGASAKDTIEVTVTAAAAKPNQIPEANAGQDIQITLPTNSTRLSGSGTDPDGRIASYRWRSVSGPKEFTINSPTRTSTTIGNLIKGTYQFELTVTDNSGATDKDTVQVSVLAAPPNLLPIANAGADINLTLPTNSATLSGSGSDPDGTVSSYQWRRISGPSQYNIVSSTKAQTTVNNLVQGTYEFELTVTDKAGASSKDTMQVIVNAAAAPINQSPAANAGSDISITLPTKSTTLSGTGNDPDGWIASYQWRNISGPSQYNIVSSTKAQTTVNNLVQGVYQFEFTVTDNSGKNAKDTVQVTVNTQVSSASSSAAAPNQAPTANAGLDINITLPTNSVILKGTGTDVDGTIASYQWNKISGPSQYNIVSATQAQTTVNNLVDGIYKFELIVSDNSGASAKDTVQVIVNPASLSANHSPTADAGSDLEITLPTDSIELSGKGSDMDGTVSSYKWSKVSGPAQYNIVSSSKAKTTVNNLVQGVYQFELTVTDNSNGSGKSTIQVTVYAAPNQLPTAKAGSDLQISLPTDTTTLTGAGTDPDGTIASYKWTKISGPVQSTVVSPSKSQTLISNLTEGVYQFELTVTDNSGASAKDTVGVIVLAVPKAFAKVFPNPATSVINIQIEGATRTSNTALRIYDNKGNLVYQEDFVRSPQPMIKQVNVSKLPSGIYFAELQTEASNITTLRFMKK